MGRLIGFLGLVASVAAAQVPPKLAYQARLLRSDGSPATGALTFTFSLFDAESSGTSLWTETQQLALSDGFYATQLGEVTPIPAGVFTGPERFLEISVSGETLSPRQRLTSVPYSLLAGEARNLAGGTVNATSISVAGTTVISSSGALAGPAAYRAGAGLSLNGSTFALLDTCNPGQVLRRDSTGWVCANESGGGSTVTDATLTGAGTAASPLSVAPTNGAFIQNQSTAAQAAAFFIGGTGRIGSTLGVGTPAPNPLVAALDVSGKILSSNTAGRNLRMFAEATTFGRLETYPGLPTEIPPTDAANWFPLVVNHDNGQSTILNQWRGRVGIGINPDFSTNHKLYVFGDARYYNSVHVGGSLGLGTVSPVNKLGVVGNIAATGTILGGVGSPDVAENITAGDAEVEAGDTVVADPGGDEQVVRSRRPYDASILGVISTRPGFLTNAQEADVSAGAPRDPRQRPIALAGRVPVKVTLEGGPIRPGDLLTTSSTPGHAMRASEPWRGGIVGTALTGYGDSGATGPAGAVVVFLNLQPAPATGAGEETSRLREELGRVSRENAELRRRLERLEAAYLGPGK